MIADDVEVIDAAPHYGLLSVQGPKATSVVQRLGLGVELPGKIMGLVSCQHPMLGELYLANQGRLGTKGWDLFVPTAALHELASSLEQAVQAEGGRFCGWDSFDMARIEAGIPRFGEDMDASNLPPEAGLEARAISYSKGCYIGQEVLARIRTYGRVAKTLRGLRFADELPGTAEKRRQTLSRGQGAWVCHERSRLADV